jgi:hypothetical protein
MDGEDLRLAVYGAFAGTGRVPSAGELAARLGVEASEVTGGRSGDCEQGSSKDRGYLHPPSGV